MTSTLNAKRISGTRPVNFSWFGTVHFITVVSRMNLVGVLSIERDGNKTNF